MIKDSQPKVVLVTVSGPDKPGITSELTNILAKSKARVLDIGQAVIHELLSLSLLIELDETSDNAPLKELLFKATEMGLKLEFQVVQPGTVTSRQYSSNYDRYAVTLMGESLSAKTLHLVAEVIAQYHLNIDTISKLSEEDFACVELLLSTTKKIDGLGIRKALLTIALSEGVDIALQSEGLFRRSKRLVVMDMDSTLIENEVIDEFAKQMGCLDQVARITEQAMQGNMNFDESLLQRCQLLKGLTTEQIEDAYGSICITSGAKKLVRVLKQLGYKTAIISGGFQSIADRLKEELGVDYAYANQMEMKDNAFTGKVLPPILNAQRKADLLDIITQQERIHLDQVVAVGDGANDLLMLEKAGLGIAFNAKPVVSEKADLALSQRNLASILHLLGMSGRDLNEIS